MDATQRGMRKLLVFPLPAVLLWSQLPAMWKHGPSIEKSFTTSCGWLPRLDTSNTATSWGGNPNCSSLPLFTVVSYHVMCSQALAGPENIKACFFAWNIVEIKQSLIFFWCISHAINNEGQFWWPSWSGWSDLCDLAYITISLNSKHERMKIQ